MCRRKVPRTHHTPHFQLNCQRLFAFVCLWSLQTFVPKKNTLQLKPTIISQQRSTEALLWLFAKIGSILFEWRVTCYLRVATPTKKLFFFGSNCFASLLAKQILYNSERCVSSPAPLSPTALAGGKGSIDCILSFSTSHHQSPLMAALSTATMPLTAGIRDAEKGGHLKRLKGKGTMWINEDVFNRPTRQAFLSLHTLELFLDD